MIPWLKAAVIAVLLALLIIAVSPFREANAEPFQSFFGSLHHHTAYSDGEGRPEDAFAAGRNAGFDYFFLTEHSEWLEFPFKADRDCLDDIFSCFAPPPPGKTEWQDIKDQGRIASDPDIPYLGLRGFEWSSPTVGHISVLLSSNYIGNGPTALTMNALWSGGLH